MLNEVNQNFNKIISKNSMQVCCKIVRVFKNKQNSNIQLYCNYKNLIKFVLLYFTYKVKTVNAILNQQRTFHFAVEMSVLKFFFLFIMKILVVKLTNIQHKLSCPPSLPNQHVVCKLLNL